MGKGMKFNHVAGLHKEKFEKCHLAKCQNKPLFSSSSVYVIVNNICRSANALTYVNPVNENLIS